MNQSRLASSGYPYLEDSGIKLLQRPEFNYYFPPRDVEILIEKILNQPNYYLIESMMDTGKTALVSHLTRIGPEYYAEVLLYVFSKDDPKYANTSVETAIKSLAQQAERRAAQLVPQIRDEQKRRGISQRPSISPTKNVNDDTLNSNTDTFSKRSSLAYSIEYLAELIEEANTLRLLNRKYANLLILIDALDNSDKVNLSELLPEDRLRENISIVVTTRPPVKDLSRSLHEKHPLILAQIAQEEPFSEQRIIYPRNKAQLYRLSNFSDEDTKRMLWTHAPGMTNVEELRELAHAIYKQTGGTPYFVSEVLELAQEFKGEAQQFIAQVKRRLPYAGTQRWDRELHRITIDSFDEKLRDQLLALFAAAKAYLSLEDIVKILDSEQEQLPIYRFLQQHQRVVARPDGHQFGLPQNFRNYLSQHIFYRPLVMTAQGKLLEWVRCYVGSSDLQNTVIPKHVLEHAAEYLVDDDELQRLFEQRVWFYKFEAVSLRRSAILRARDAAHQRNHYDTKYKTHIINLIGCYLIAASFCARLQPEDMLQLVAWGKITKDQARDYATTYIDQVDQQRVLNGLEDPKPPQQVLFTDDDQNLIDQLQGLDELPEEVRNQIYHKWLRDFECARMDPGWKKDEQVQLDVLTVVNLPISADAPSYEQETNDTLNSFEQELENLTLPPINQSLTDQHLHNLQRVVQAWLRSSSEQVALVQLHKILFRFTSASRVQLLEGLSVLNLGLAKRYPDIMSDIRMTVKRIVDNYP